MNLLQSFRQAIGRIRVETWLSRWLSVALILVIDGRHFLVTVPQVASVPSPLSPSGEVYFDGQTESVKLTICE